MTAIPACSARPADQHRTRLPAGGQPPDPRGFSPWGHPDVFDIRLGWRYRAVARSGDRALLRSNPSTETGDKTDGSGPRKWVRPPSTTVRTGRLGQHRARLSSTAPRRISIK
jgi:hypothetical protein